MAKYLAGPANFSPLKKHINMAKGRRHAKAKEKREVLAWQASTKATISETVAHFANVWNGKIAVSERSIRRWRAKLYGFGHLHEHQGTDATALTLSEASTSSFPDTSTHVHGAEPVPLYEFKEVIAHAAERSIFFEEEHMHEQCSPRFRPLAKNRGTMRMRRAHAQGHVRSRATRRIRYVPPATSATVQQSKASEDNAYWYLYKHHRQWARECHAEGKAPPELDPALAAILYEKFKVVC